MGAVQVALRVPFSALSVLLCVAVLRVADGPIVEEETEQ